MANNNNLFAFARGSTTTENHSPDPWLILSVEDDPDYQASLAMALEFVEVAGRPVQLLRAGSAFEAARLIPEHPDISVILLDVVMESDDAGLSLVRTIREVIGNTLVRIVLLTNLRLASRLHKLAYRDPELDLPNRNQFLRYLGQHLRSRARKRHLMVLQLYEFNEMAFQLGDRFASQILSGVAQTLRNILSNPDGCARVDRSSFAALMESPAACHELADALNQPIETEGGSYRVSICSVCLPLDEFGEEQTSTLLNTAEIAMEQARENRSNPLFFSQYDQAPILERYTLLTRLRQALDDHSLAIFLQPKVELETGLLAGFEALVRWPQADGSYIRPDQFIPIAEHGGLIGELDLQVLDKTLQTIQLLQEQGIHAPVAFNASPLDLFEPSHFETMLRMISDSGINPTLLELEVTESRAMEEYDMISERLQQLMDMGVGVSIDDFGTGYSSLGHITHLAASTLKIDRSFVFRMEESTDAVHVVDMILRLSRRFSFKVVAEGVETDTQRKLLLELGCSIGQGYLFSPPLPVNDAVDWALHHSS